jgi:DNA primase
MIEAKPDILAVMDSEGIELKRRGRSFWAPCPFHADKTPSFKVSPERQRWHCFGACSTGGDVVDFIQKRRGIDFKDALKVLGLRHGRPAPPDSAVLRRRELVKAFEAWRRSYRLELSDAAIVIHSIIYNAKKRKTPPHETLAFLAAEEMARLPLIEHRLDILFSGDDEAIFGLYEDAQNDKL